MDAQQHAASRSREPNRHPFYPYTITSRGVNEQGNRYDTRIQSGGPAYRYSNRDGSWTYRNNDQSRYFNDGNGSSIYTAPDGTRYQRYDPRHGVADLRSHEKDLSSEYDDDVYDEGAPRPPYTTARHGYQQSIARCDGEQRGQYLTDSCQHTRTSLPSINNRYHGIQEDGFVRNNEETYRGGAYGNERGNPYEEMYDRGGAYADEREYEQAREYGYEGPHGFEGDDINGAA